jgi:hypothetical protein
MFDSRFIQQWAISSKSESNLVERIHRSIICYASDRFGIWRPNSDFNRVNLIDQNFSLNAWTQCSQRLPILAISPKWLGIFSCFFQNHREFIGWQLVDVEFQPSSILPVLNDCKEFWFTGVGSLKRSFQVWSDQTKCSEASENYQRALSSWNRSCLILNMISYLNLNMISHLNLNMITFNFFVVDDFDLDQNSFIRTLVGTVSIL